MEKVKVNKGKIFEVTFTIPGDETKQTFSDGKKVQTRYSYSVYAVNETHARQIVESYDEEAQIINIEESGDCISQHYGE